MKKYKTWHLYLAIIAISFLQGLQFTVSSVLGDIAKHYPDVPVSLIQMTITGPALLSMIVSLASGWLVLKISKKKLLVFGAMEAGIMGFLPFLADSFPLLLGTRVLFGICLGIATTMNVAVVAEFFEGSARVKAMGIQAASIGAGMAVINFVVGLLGQISFQTSYWINMIAFLCMAILMTFLPDTGRAKPAKGEKIQLNARVYILDLFTIVEFLFVITITTNIAMHLDGSLAGSSSVSGTVTSCFAAAQICIGLVLGLVVKLTRKYTLAVAMASFAIGALLIALNPASLPLLGIGAAFCGFSQGMFVPTAATEMTNVVNPVSAAMASATLTIAMNLGQFISPTLVNGMTKGILGEATTTNVYLLGSVCMAITAVMMVFYRHFTGRRHRRELRAEGSGR